MTLTYKEDKELEARLKVETLQVQVEQWFVLRAHICPSVYLCPFSSHTEITNIEETKT